MKYWQVYIFLWCVCFASLQAHANTDTLRLKNEADSLYHAQQFYRAAIAYQKLEFFSSTETAKVNARLRAADSYKWNGQYQEGIATLQVINLSDAADSLVFKVKHQSALMSYLLNDLSQASAFIEQLNYLVKDSAYTYDAMLLHALILNDQYKWNEAKEKLKQLNKHIYTNNQLVYNRNIKVIDSLYATTLQPRLKDPDKAARLSTFLPGAGQFYTKNYGEGIFSFMSLAVTAGVMVVGVVYQYYFTSIFVGNLLIAKFYQGGVKRSEFLANKYNYKKAKIYNEQLKNFVRKGFVSTKQ